MAPAPVLVEDVRRPSSVCDAGGRAAAGDGEERHSWRRCSTDSLT